MRVMLDLRPAGIVAVQKKRVDPLRLVILLLFFIFTTVSSINIVIMIYEIFALQNSLAESVSEVENEKNNVIKLNTEIDDLRKIAREFMGFLTFTNTDIPVVEVLTALEAVTPKTLKIESFTLNPGNAAITGVAIKDEIVVQFAQNLGQIPEIIDTVNMPVMSKRVIASKVASEFTLTCLVRDLGSIFASTNSNQQQEKESLPAEGQNQ